MAQHVPRDVWNIIAEDLKLRDLLALRATCTTLNKYVIGMNARWYRAHQWFIAQTASHSKVKSAIKVHTRRLGFECVPYDYQYPGRTPADTYHQRRVGAQKAIDDGEFTEADCTISWHFAHKIPKSEQDIPLDKFYKPKQNNYIYFYLIQCYKYRHPRHQEKLRFQRNNIERWHYEIQQSKAHISCLTRRIQLGQVELSKLEETKYVDNEIFEGKAVNRYKTPAQLRTKPPPAKRKRVAEPKPTGEKTL